ncbi:MAG: DUF1841 family protein [Candidatus Thiodiazotropha sp.]
MSGDRNQLRRVFFEAWRKHLAGEDTELLEKMVVSVIVEHPEYHEMLNDSERFLLQEFHADDGQGNPFLHMAMHISLLEQISTDRPVGISECYQRLCQRKGEAHEAEHQLMECLGRILWEAQSANRTPDEQAYLDCIKTLLN